MRSAVSCLLLAACVTSSGESSDELARARRIVVDLGPTRSTVGPALLGANINTWYANAGGVWDGAAEAPNVDVVAKTAQARLGLLRFPGGTSASLYDWKRGIGPRGQRACQMEAHDLHARHDNDYGPAEFGELLQQTGAAGQVMVPIMRITPQDAADWVEYMNGPADEIFEPRCLDLNVVVARLQERSSVFAG